MEKKVLFGFGQTGDHKTPKTSWVSTCVKKLKGNKYKGVGDFNFWPLKLCFFGKIFPRARVVVQSTVGQAVLGQAVLGQAVLGQAVLGQAVLEQCSLGTVLGQSWDGAVLGQSWARAVLVRSWDTGPGTVVLGQ